MERWHVQMEWWMDIGDGFGNPGDAGGWGRRVTTLLILGRLACLRINRFSACFTPMRRSHPVEVGTWPDVWSRGKQVCCSTRPPGQGCHGLEIFGWLRLRDELSLLPNALGGPWIQRGQ